MKYLLISEIGADNFTQKVNEAIANGYEPTGGATLCIYTFNGHVNYWYTQALVRQVG